MVERTDAAAGLATSRVTWADALWIAVFLGLLAGVVEVVVALFKMFALNRFVWLSRDLLWMAPLAAVTFALIPGLVVALLARFWRAVHIGWVVGLLAFCGIFALLLAVPRIAHYATAIVAAGVAFQLGVSARRSPGAWLRVARRGSLVLALAVATLGIGERVWRVAAERIAVGRLAPASPDVPNVLLIIFDTVRRANLGLYGYSRPTTPRLEQRASQSVVFDFALSAAPWTLPSHASMFTGKFPDSTTGDWRGPMDDGQRTLASTLRERGFVTGGFVDNLLYTSYESGLDAGFLHFVDYPVTFPVIVRHFAPGRSAMVTGLLQSRTLGDVWRAVRGFNLDKAREAADEPPNAARRSTQFLEWERRRGDRPFFAFINYFEAHGLFRPTAELERQFPGGKRLDWYDAAIAHLDAEVGRVLDTLEQRGVLDNTIVVITSDHGEHFGEHGLSGHANSLYLQLLRVPLLIRFPRAVPRGRVLPDPVTLQDLPATILHLAGMTAGTGIPGSTLSRLWQASAQSSGSPLYAALSQGINVAPEARNARGSLASLIDQGYHYIQGPGASEELYAYATDSLELSNVVATPDVQAKVQQLRTSLRALSMPGSARP